MDKDTFNKLSKKQKDILVTKALAWFCVFCYMNPLLVYQNAFEEVEVIKIVLGQFKD